MSFVELLKYITEHSPQFIQWTSAAIVLCAAYIGFRMVFRGANGGSFGASPEVEATLKRILSEGAGTATGSSASVDGLPNESAHFATSMPSISGGGVAAAVGSPSKATSTAAVGVGSAQGAAASDLRVQIAEQEKQIVELRQKAAGSQQSQEELRAALEKIKDLEGKLAEYEIIEDDIADLSHFKEENAKLKAELEKVRGGGSIEASVEITPALEESGASEVPPSEDQTASAFLDDAVAAALSDAGAEAILGSGKSDLVAEFESAVSQTKTKAPPRSPEAPTAASVSAPASAPGTEAKDDLLSEFEASLEEVANELSAGPDENALEGDIDTSRMLAEMDNLAGLESDGSTGLEESLDVDKMAAEAGTLGQDKG